MKIMIAREARCHLHGSWYPVKSLLDKHNLKVEIIQCSRTRPVLCSPADTVTDRDLLGKLWAKDIPQLLQPYITGIGAEAAGRTNRIYSQRASQVTVHELSY